MAYDTKDLEQRAIKAIEEHKLFFITDIPPMIGISRQTFYDHQLDKVDAIKDALISNRVQVKASMRNKWYKSDNPTLQIGLYKLIGDDDEYYKLANTKHDVTTREEKAPFTGFDVTDAQEEEDD